MLLCLALPPFLILTLWRCRWRAKVGCGGTSLQNTIINPAMLSTPGKKTVSVHLRLPPALHADFFFASDPPSSCSAGPVGEDLVSLAPPFFHHPDKRHQLAGVILLSANPSPDRCSAMRHCQNDLANVLATIVPLAGYHNGSCKFFIPRFLSRFRCRLRRVDSCFTEARSRTWLHHSPRLDSTPTTRSGSRSISY